MSGSVEEAAQRQAAVRAAVDAGAVVLRRGRVREGLEVHGAALTHWREVDDVVERTDTALRLSDADARDAMAVRVDALLAQGFVVAPLARAPDVALRTHRYDVGQEPSLHVAPLPDCFVVDDVAPSVWRARLAEPGRTEALRLHFTSVDEARTSALFACGLPLGLRELCCGTYADAQDYLDATLDVGPLWPHAEALEALDLRAGLLLVPRRGLPNLRRLALWSERADEGLFEALVARPWPKLSSLTVSLMNDAGGASLQVARALLRGAGAFPSLVRLTLVGAGTDDGFLAELGHSALARQLHVLNLERGTFKTLPPPRRAHFTRLSGLELRDVVTPAEAFEGWPVDPLAPSVLPRGVSALPSGRFFPIS